MRNYWEPKRIRIARDVRQNWVDEFDLESDDRPVKKGKKDTSQKKGL